MLLSMEYGDFKPHEADAFELDPMICMPSTLGPATLGLRAYISGKSVPRANVTIITCMYVYMYVCIYHIAGNF